MTIWRANWRANYLKPGRSYVVILLGLLVGLSFSNVGESHIREGAQRWYFSGVTFGKKDGKYRPSDPVNVVFWGGGPNAPIAEVREHVQADFRMYDLCPSSTQWVYFTSRDDWNGSLDYAVYGGVDETASSWASACGRKFHIRMWDDYEHWARTWDHPTRDRWAIGGVHRERFCLKKKVHCIFRDWDVVEASFRNRMEEHCSYLRWKYHPGADRRLQGFDSDGRFVLIHMRHVDDPGPCPRPPLGG